MYLRPEEEDDRGSLERVQESLYGHDVPIRERVPYRAPNDEAHQHEWAEERELSKVSEQRGERHVRFASIFFGTAVAFFLLSLAVAGYFFYFGSNSVSIDKITIDVVGPTTIAGGDTIPLSITVTNKNPVAIENAVIEIHFPDGTRSAINALSPYPRFVENLGTLASGETVTRSARAVVYGGAGQTLVLPVVFAFGTANSNATFEKKLSYPLSISSTPLSVAVDSLTETVSGEPLTFMLTVRSNAKIPLANVVVSAASPFGFSVASSSIPLDDSVFYIGTLLPGASKQITLTGTLSGQNNEQRVFHFTVGTAKSAQDRALSVAYMTQDASVSIAAPFITTSLALNGDTSKNVVITPGSVQSVSLSYSNMLSTTVTNASIAVAVSGSAIDYDSIQTTNGFYNSIDHTVVFSRETDPALASLSPGAAGVGTFTFSTLPAGRVAPAVTFALSVSGTRIGQTNVPEQVTVSAVKTAKVTTTVILSSRSSRTGGLFESSGPVPPRANQTTTYAIVWDAQNKGSAIAGGTVSAALPSFVSYTGVTSGTGSFSYDSVSRVVTWNVGDLAQGASTQGIFQVSLTPSTSQRGDVVPLTSEASFSGHDRFAGVTILAGVDPVTTDTKDDAGYIPGNGIVQ